VSILGMPRLGRKGLGLIFILPLCKKIFPKNCRQLLSAYYIQNCWFLKS
jgi:hypothetical protein